MTTGRKIVVSVTFLLVSAIVHAEPMSPAEELDGAANMGTVVSYGLDLALLPGTLGSEPRISDESIQPFLATSGTCSIACFGNNTITRYNVSSTYDQCCSGSINPCPAGTNPRVIGFTPYGGSTSRCY